MEVKRHLKRHVLTFFRRIDQWMLGPRYLAKRLALRKANPSPVLSIVDSVPTRVINLESRSDRLRETEAELAQMGITQWSRFSAVKDSNGALGCALSHAQLMEQVQGL